MVFYGSVEFPKNNIKTLKKQDKMLFGFSSIIEIKVLFLWYKMAKLMIL